jgi:hypothetical protein
MAKPAISDEKLAQFIETRMRLMNECLIQLGRCSDQLNRALEQLAMELQSLKQAIHSSEVQLDLPFDDGV